MSLFFIMAVKKEKIDLLLLMDEESTTTPSATATSHLADVKKPMSPRLRELRQELFRTKKMCSLPSRLENDARRGSLPSDKGMATPEHRKSTKRLSIASARSQKQRIMDFASKKMWLHKTINYDDRRDSDEIGLINHGVATAGKYHIHDMEGFSSPPDIIYGEDVGSDSSTSGTTDPGGSLDSVDMTSSIKSLNLNQMNHHYSFDCRDSVPPLVETYNRRWNSLPEKLKQDSIDKGRKSSIEGVESPLAAGSYQYPIMDRLNSQSPTSQDQTFIYNNKNPSFDFDEPTSSNLNFLNFNPMEAVQQNLDTNCVNVENNKNFLSVDHQSRNSSPSSSSTSQIHKIKIYADTRARSLPETILENSSEALPSNTNNDTTIVLNNSSSFINDNVKNHADGKRNKYAKTKHKSNDDIVDSADHVTKTTTKYKVKKYHFKKISLDVNNLTCNHRQCLQESTALQRLGGSHDDEMQQQQHNGCRFKRMNSLPESSHPMSFWNGSFEDMKNERHFETVEVCHPIVDVERTDFQNNVTKWNIDEMITAYIEKQNEDHVTLANDNLIFGAEKCLLLPDKYSLDDKYMFLKNRHIRRNAVHIYDTKTFKDLLTVYISMKRVMGYSIL